LLSVRREDARRAEREAAGLRQKLAALEHSARQREAETRRLQQKLADVLAKARFPPRLLLCCFMLRRREALTLCVLRAG
jgi:hypothetical protein